MGLIVYSDIMINQKNLIHTEQKIKSLTGRGRLTRKKKDELQDTIKELNIGLTGFQDKYLTITLGLDKGEKEKIMRLVRSGNMVTQIQRTYMLNPVKLLTIWTPAHTPKKLLHAKLKNRLIGTARSKLSRQHYSESRYWDLSDSYTYLSIPSGKNASDSKIFFDTVRKTVTSNVGLSLRIAFGKLFKPEKIDFTSNVVLLPDFI